MKKVFRVSAASYGDLFLHEKQNIEPFILLKNEINKVSL